MNHRTLPFAVRTSLVLLLLILVLAPVGCSSSKRSDDKQEAVLVPQDPEFRGRLDTLGKAYESRNAEQIMAFYTHDTYSLSFDLPYKFDTHGDRHRASLQRLLAGATEVKVELAPEVEVWKTDKRVWTIRYFTASGKLATGESFDFKGWHSAIWENRGGAWLINYEHFAGPFGKAKVTAPPAAVPAVLPVQCPPAAEVAEDPFEDIFFDYDKWDIRPDQVATAMANVEWLKAHPTAEILIEGHCDERGSLAYNVALGQRRAESAMKFLVENGIERDRIKIMTFGKERPFDSDRPEPHWGQNRRAHFVLRRL